MSCSTLVLRVFLGALCCAQLCGAQIAQAEDTTMSIGQATENALKRSQLTLPGSAPFHLKAKIIHATSCTSQYRATIEEYWLSPASWRRTIESPGFSQTLVVDGDKISEQDKGDYYPFWLRNLVTAIFDPLPMREQLQDFRGTVTLPSDSEESNACLNAAVPAGVPPIKANITYAFCFLGQRGLLQQVNTPGYMARFEDYRPFHDKMVARRITAALAPDTTLEAKITTLDDTVPADRAFFTVDEPSPAASQLRNQQVGEATARTIAVFAPDVIWPPVREGKNSGTMSLYISTDKLGHVREVWPVVSDNQELTAAAQEQLLHWRFQPYVNGFPMQMESVLTFAFNTMMGPPIPLLSNAAARKLASRIAEPHLRGPRSSKPVQLTFRVRVDEQGRILRIQSIGKAEPGMITAGERALKQWQFRPYRRDGQPDRFDADIVFTVQPAGSK